MRPRRTRSATDAARDLEAADRSVAVATRAVAAARVFFAFGFRLSTLFRPFLPLVFCIGTQAAAIGVLALPRVPNKVAADLIVITVATFITALTLLNVVLLVVATVTVMYAVPAAHLTRADATAALDDARAHRRRVTERAAASGAAAAGAAAAGRH